jgi:hypothetical protein
MDNGREMVFGICLGGRNVIVQFEEDWLARYAAGMEPT